MKAYVLILLPEAYYNYSCIQKTWTDKKGSGIA